MHIPFDIAQSWIGRRVKKSRAYSEEEYCRYGGEEENLPIGTEGIIRDVHKCDETGFYVEDAEELAFSIGFDNGIDWDLDATEFDFVDERRIIDEALRGHTRAMLSTFITETEENNEAPLFSQGEKVLVREDLETCENFQGTYVSIVDYMLSMRGKVFTIGDVQKNEGTWIYTLLEDAHNFTWTSGMLKRVESVKPFSLGTRVRCIRTFEKIIQGSKGTIIDIKDDMFGVKWDNIFTGFDLWGKISSQTGFYVPKSVLKSEVKPIKQQKTITKKKIQIIEEISNNKEYANCFNDIKTIEQEVNSWSDEQIAKYELDKKTLKATKPKREVKSKVKSKAKSKATKSKKRTKNENKN